jgi:hypothetical protein
MNIYNTQPLLNEIEIVIKNGLDKMLSKYLERYDLLEKTHKQLMNLPSIKEAIGKDYEQDVESDTESYSETKNPEINNIVSCQTEMKYDVLNIESKLDKLEKKYAGLYPMLDKILDKIETLNNDVQKMKTMPITATSTSVEPTIVSACQNENIKFEIKEDDTESVEVEEDDESLEDDTESLEDEDDVNPALITCATVKITKEALEVVPNDKVEIVKVVKLEPEIIPVSENVEEEEEEEEEEVVEEDSKSVETETKSDTESVEDEEVIEEEKAKEVDAEDMEDELEVITIDDVDYCTNNEENGFIWELTEDGEQGAKVGYLKDGEPFFYAEEN